MLEGSGRFGKGKEKIHTIIFYERVVRFNFLLPDPIHDQTATVPLHYVGGWRAW